MTALANPSILQSLWWAQIDKTTMSQAERDAAKGHIAGVGAIQDGYDAAVSNAHQNGDLSAQGRAAALKAASTRSLAQLDALSTPALAALDKQIVGYTRALRQAASGPDATAVTELRAIETRAAFAQVDPLLRPMMYLDLCASGTDDAACLAMENAPVFAPLLSPEAIEQGRLVRGERSLPDQAHALMVAQDVRALLASATSTARRHMTIADTLDPFVLVSGAAEYPIEGADDGAA